MVLSHESVSLSQINLAFNKSNSISTFIKQTADIWPAKWKPKTPTGVNGEGQCSLLNSTRDWWQHTC